MSRPLHVVLPVLRDSARELSGVAESLRAGLGGLDESVSGLVGGSWSGDASAQYGQVWHQWHEGAGAVVSGLSDLSEWMGLCAREFSRMDGGG